MRKNINNEEMLEFIKEAKPKAKKRQLMTISDKSQLSTEDKFKMSLCRLFVQYLNEQKMKPSELHELTGIEQSRISEILHYKITKFTIDKLLSWLSVLADHSAKIKEHLKLIEATLNLQVQSVSKTKKLTNSIKKANYAY